MALRKFLILRKLRSGCLEGRTALIQLIVDFLTASFAGAMNETPSAMPARLEDDFEAMRKQPMPTPVVIPTSLAGHFELPYGPIGGAESYPAASRNGCATCSSQIGIFFPK